MICYDALTGVFLGNHLLGKPSNPMPLVCPGIGRSAVMLYFHFFIPSANGQDPHGTGTILVCLVFPQVVRFLFY